MTFSATPRDILLADEDDRDCTSGFCCNSLPISSSPCRLLSLSLLRYLHLILPQSSSDKRGKGKLAGWQRRRRRWSSLYATVTSIADYVPLTLRPTDRPPAHKKRFCSFRFLCLLSILIKFIWISEPRICKSHTIRGLWH